MDYYTRCLAHGTSKAQFASTLEESEPCAESGFANIREVYDRYVRRDGDICVQCCRLYMRALTEFSDKRRGLLGKFKFVHIVGIDTFLFRNCSVRFDQANAELCVFMPPRDK